MADRLPITEAQWQQTVLDTAAAHGWTVAHFRPARTVDGWRTPVAADGKGWPDLVLVRDRVIFAELKSARGRLSGDQQAWIHRLTAAGQEVHVWRPDDWPHVEYTLARRSNR
jgi:hypothetical protein